MAGRADRQEHMTVFEAVKDSVNIVDAAGRYGLQLDRRGKAHCCFHSPDTHASLSFKNGGYTCFSCGAKGDVISLVAHLTGARKPIEAVQLLNSDYSLGLDVGGKIDPTAARKYTWERERVKAFKRWEQKSCNTWAAYCRMLRSWKRDYAPNSPEDDPDLRYLEACHKLDYADYIYETVFINGCRDMEVQVKFYKNFNREVERIGNLIRDNGFTG